MNPAGAAPRPQPAILRRLDRLRRYTRLELLCAPLFLQESHSGSFATHQAHNRDQRGYVVVVTGVLYGTTRRSLHPVESWTAVHCGPNLALLPTYVYRLPPLPALSLSFSTPLPRRGHRSQFILPTPLPGARYSLRLAIPSSLCLSYHSARPELQCGYPPFTAHPPCARRRRHRAVETLLICLGCILFSKCLSHFRISHISNRLFFLD